MKLMFITAGRFDLFERNVKSIAAIEDICRVNEISIIDDASPAPEIEAMAKLVREILPGRRFTIHTREKPVGYRLQMERWRSLLGDDPFSFHCEDDWEFKEPGRLITAATDVLQHDPCIAQVVFTLPCGGNELLRTANGTGYWISRPGRYLPYTSNPSIVRVSAFKQAGSFCDELEGHGEHDFGKKLMNLGYLTAFLEQRYAWHTGHGRSAFTANQTPR